MNGGDGSADKDSSSSVGKEGSIVGRGRGSGYVALRLYSILIVLGLSITFFDSKSLQPIKNNFLSAVLSVSLLLPSKDNDDTTNNDTSKKMMEIELKQQQQQQQKETMDSTLHAFMIERKQKQKQEATRTAASIHDTLCNSTTTNKRTQSTEMEYLCAHDFFKVAGEQLLQGDHVHMVQIGAHVGFEENDPVGSTVVDFLQHLSDIGNTNSNSNSSNSSTVNNNNNITQHFHWTFVEPSPPNYERLIKNLESRKGLCDMQGINAGIVPDTLNITSSSSSSSAEMMPFYSFAPSIDPETGYDSLSGKTLPPWITQVSGFTMGPINFNQGVFRKQRLNMSDYIVKTQVTMLHYSELMKEHVKVEGRPFFLMIDTEGFDCKIVEGIDQDSKWIPQFLLFETHCKWKPTLDHLKTLGYETIKTQHNAVGISK